MDSRTTSIKLMKVHDGEPVLCGDDLSHITVNILILWVTCGPSWNEASILLETKERWKTNPAC